MYFFSESYTGKRRTTAEGFIKSDFAIEG